MLPKSEPDTIALIAAYVFVADLTIFNVPVQPVTLAYTFTVYVPAASVCSDVAV